MELAISQAIDIFGERYVCRKWKDGAYDSRFNRAVFDVIIASLVMQNVSDWAVSHPKKFEQAFKDLCQSDREFLESIETTTKSKSAVRKRFGAWFNKLQMVSGISFSYPFDVDALAN
jgi:hypothetical protein